MYVIIYMYIYCNISRSNIPYIDRQLNYIVYFDTGQEVNLICEAKTLNLQSVTLKMCAFIDVQQ